MRDEWSEHQEVRTIGYCVQNRTKNKNNEALKSSQPEVVQNMAYCKNARKPLAWQR
jgi:hypothetical protein